jgi:hypothetical protein
MILINIALLEVRTAILKQKSELHLECPMATASKVLTSKTNPVQKKSFVCLFQSKR